ncbi:MAG: glycoside hydrolase family 10 protein [Chthoniobacterales bacterium]
MKASAPKSWLSFVFLLALALAAQAEFRGAWIAAVHNLDWPSKQGLPAAQQKAELVRLLDSAKSLGLTDVFFQVRPEGDALYKSSLEPWSRFLTGTQGKDPGYDPLAFCISEAGKRGIRVHAWFNPYRASVKAGNQLASNHMARRYSRHAHRVGSVVCMDPGSKGVQDHVVKVVGDVARRFNVAGIHFDDYFDPYPSVGRLPDGKTYDAYRAGGGSLSIGDWRRDNVNRLIARSAQAVKAARPDAVFGVSPFGIYTKGQPSTVKAGLDQLNEIYADPLKWMRSGWVDYVAPQLYWKDNSPQSFTELLKWWRDPRVNPRHVPVYPGIVAYRMSEQGWPAQEIVRQVALSRTVGSGPSGHIFFRMENLANNTKGVSTMLKKAGY